MRASEVLMRAHGVLRERGWGQGLMESADGRVCAVGAIRLAAGATFCAIYTMTDEQYLASETARDYLSSVIGGARDVDWNDRQRNVGKVLAALDCAASAALSDEAAE